MSESDNVAIEWWVKLKGNEYDLEYLRERLRATDSNVVEDAGVFYLKSAAFLKLAGASEVFDSAVEQLCRIRGASLIAGEQVLDVQIAGIELAIDDIPRKQFILAESIGPSGRVFPPSIIQDGMPANFEPRESYLEQLERIAAVDPAVAKVTRLVGGTNLSWMDLYKVYEVIEEDVGSLDDIAERRWTTKSEVRLFKRTSQHPESIGDDARHGVSRTEPPRNPMTLSDARNLILGMAREWLIAKRQASSEH